jgi:hypothetical protein
MYSMHDRSRRAIVITIMLVISAVGGAAPAQAKPDLIISAVTPLPLTVCRPGAAVAAFLVTVENRGDAVTPAITVKDVLKIEDQHGVGWESSEIRYDDATAGGTSAIPPNGKRPVRISLPYLAGNADHMWDVATHPLRFTIDPNGVVDEQFEQNNARLMLLLPVQLAHCAPDLTVVSAQFVRNATGGYAEVTVKNDGGRPVQRFIVALVNTKAAAGREWRTTWSEHRLQSGESVTVRVIRSTALDERGPEPGGRPRPTVPPWTDFSCLNAVVDPNNQVAESKDSNNEARCIPVTGGSF